MELISTQQIPALPTNAQLTPAFHFPTTTLPPANREYNINCLNQNNWLHFNASHVGKSGRICM